MAEQAQTAQKSKRDALRDRMLGAVMITAGIALTLTGLKAGHISMVWPIVGLAGIALFADSFLKQKTAKIILNIVVILALAGVYFSVRSFNDSAAQKNPAEQNTTETAEHGLTEENDE